MRIYVDYWHQIRSSYYLARCRACFLVGDWKSGPKYMVLHAWSSTFNLIYASTCALQRPLLGLVSDWSFIQGGVSALWNSLHQELCLLCAVRHSSATNYHHSVVSSHVAVFLYDTRPSIINFFCCRLYQS